MVSIFYVGDTDRGVTDSIINHGVYRNRHTVFGEHLENKSFSSKTILTEVVLNLSNLMSVETVSTDTIDIKHEIQTLV